MADAGTTTAPTRAGAVTRYAVATQDIAPGTRITPGMLELIPIDLPDEQRARAFDQLEPLYETTAIEDLAAGELRTYCTPVRGQEEPAG